MFSAEPSETLLCKQLNLDKMFRILVNVKKANITE